MKRRRWLPLLLAILLIGTISACGTAKPSTEPAKSEPQPASAPVAQPEAEGKSPKPLTPIKAKVGVAGLSINFLHFWLAEKNGFFKEEGLDLEPIFINGGPMDIQALIAGEIDLDVTASSVSLSAAVEGSDVVIISTFVPFGPHHFVVRPGIKSAADLKGTKIGVSKLGSESHSVAIKAVSMLGLDPAKDVVFLATGGQASRFQALIAGSIDATVISPPGTSTLKKQGYTVMVDLMKEKLETAHENVVVRKKLIEKNPEMIQRFMRGFARGIHYFRTNPEGTKKIMAEYLNLDPVKDKEDIDEAYEIYKQYQTPIAPYPALEGIREQLKTLAEQKTRPELASQDPSKYADSRFVKELEDSGFLKKLYGQ